MLVVQGLQGGVVVAEILLDRGVQRPTQLDRGRGSAPSPAARRGDAGVVQRRHSDLTIYVYLAYDARAGRTWRRPTSPPDVLCPRQETVMHPWTMQRLAEERSQELLRERRRPGRRARRGSPRRCGSHPWSTAGRRGISVSCSSGRGGAWSGPTAPASGVRPRLALRGSGAVDGRPLLSPGTGADPAEQIA